LKNIDKGIRVVNYLTDYFVTVFLFVLIFIFSGSGELNPAYYYVTLCLYYFILEFTTGQTLGKVVTKTKVVTKKGLKPSIFRILARSLLRLVPFDILSFLFGTELGLHDILSGTRLKKYS